MSTALVTQNTHTHSDPFLFVNKSSDSTCSCVRCRTAGACFCPSYDWHVPVLFRFGSLRSFSSRIPLRRQQQQQHYNTLVLNVYYLLEYIVDFISHHRRSV